MNSIARLEKGLSIALKRVYEDIGRFSAKAFVDYLDTDGLAQYDNEHKYQAWQDVKRLVGELEALEQAAGIRHVKVVGHVG
jgi:hypothetical protein